MQDHCKKSKKEDLFNKSFFIKKDKNSGSVVDRSAAFLYYFSVTIDPVQILFYLLQSYFLRKLWVLAILL